MSQLIVPVATIEEIRPHNNSDNLELARVLGWQVVVQKGKYSPGDTVVYVPPDSMIPLELSEKLGVTKYLSKQRTKSVKLRGEPSFGFLIEPELDWQAGANVAEHYGITKYEPPITTTSADAASDHPLFDKYTDIENLRHFPNVFQLGENVVVTEKIHGMNVRVGIIEDEWMAGSHRLRRKDPGQEEWHINSYWFPVTIPGVRHLAQDIAREGHKQVIIFGEVYGRGVQSFDYGAVKNPQFRAFDLLVDGKYMSWEYLGELFRLYQIPAVPELYVGPYFDSIIHDLSKGNTTLDGTHIREGVVVKPMVERRDPTVGRVILKYLNEDYLIRKSDGKVTDSTDV